MGASDWTIPGDWVRAAIGAVTQTSPRQVLFASRAGCRVAPVRAKPIAGNREPVHGLHRHDMPEVCIAIGGAALLSLDGDVFEVREPRVAVVAPGVDHFEAAVRRRTPYSLMWMHFCPDGSLIALAIVYQPDNGWTCAQRCVLKFGPIHHLADLLSAGVPSQPRHFEAIRADLLIVLAELHRMIVRTDQSPTKANRNSVDKYLAILQGVQDFLDQNFTKRLSVREIAASSRFSPDYLNSMFSKWKGESIGEYLIRRRMEAGLLLCREGKMMVKEIALGLGYDDALYFSRAFHRYHGFWPTEIKPPLGANNSD